MFLKLKCSCFNFVADCCCGGLVGFLKPDAASEGGEDRKLSSEGGWTATGVQAVAAADTHVIARFKLGRVPDGASTNQTGTKVQAGSSGKIPSARRLMEAAYQEEILTAKSTDVSPSNHLISALYKFIIRIQESFWMKSFSPKNKRRLHISCNIPN